MTLDQLFASPWGALAILCLRVVDVSFDTMRVIFTIRGRRGVAALLGFIMAMVWIFAAGNAVKHLDSWLHIFGYAAGYGLGNFVGITIERTVAYGINVVRIFTRRGEEIAAALRERGHGVTVFVGHGREGKVDLIMCATQRAHLDDLVGVVETHDPSAFLTIEEPKSLRGGSVVEREWAPWRSSRPAAGTEVPLARGGDPADD
jgi:uncharacterized protein YebE (UPF0316 family)